MTTLTVYDINQTPRPSRYYLDILAPSSVMVLLDEEYVLSVKMNMTRHGRRRPFHIEKHPSLNNFSMEILTISPDHSDKLTLRLRNTKVSPFDPMRYEWHRKHLLDSGAVLIEEGTPLFRVYAGKYSKFNVRYA